MAPWSADGRGNGCHDCGAFLLDFVGRFRRGDVSVRWSEGQRPSSEAEDRAIEEAWHEQLAAARRDGRWLVNGRLCRLIECQAGNGVLHLTLGEVSYKEFVGTNLTNAPLRYVHGPEVLANPLGVSAAIVSSDGFLLLGRRSRLVFTHGGRLHPIAGIVQPPDVAGNLPNPFQAIAEEIEEELGLPGEALRLSECLGMIRDKQIVQPELIFDVRVDAGEAEIRRSAAGAADALEHEEIVATRDQPGAVVAFVREHAGELTSAALAMLLLHGQRHWGTGWFVSARACIQGVG